VKLGEKKARVLADTTLVGLSDQDASFQNTETFRYRELEVDEKGELKPTGVTREISAGLVFKIKGWVSGDEMISMNVSATISKRGADASSSTGTLPTTSEQVVTTNVRTTSGKPVVIGGLIRQQTNVLVTKVPILGDIPLLGLLFQARTESIENTELVIYILPRVDHAGVEETDIGLGLERLHRKFVAPALHE
jgi:general secretion pathway protein D